MTHKTEVNLSFLLISLIFLCGHAVSNIPETNEHFIKAPAAGAVPHYRRLMQELQKTETVCTDPACFTFGICMLFDSRIYNPDTGKYTLESFIEQGKSLYGGYDVLLLWHGYPRLGVDPRNQFDFWHDLPGGLEELARQIALCHEHRVRVLLPYNPWDTGTRSETESLLQSLVDLVRQTGADGVFLDTLSASQPQLRQMLDAIRPELMIVTEGVPLEEQIGMISSSWGQWLSMPAEPSILKLKWIHPAHQQYLINRWDRDRSEEIATAFFNSAGLIVWDNVFGTNNPWNDFDRACWKKANLILHHFSTLLNNGDCTPFADTLSPALYANLWQDKNQKLYLFNYNGQPAELLPLIAVNNTDEYTYFDLWNGSKFQPSAQKTLSAPINRIGCIAAIKETAITSDFIKLTEKLKTIQTDTIQKTSALPIISYTNTICRTHPVPADNKPKGMVYIPAADFSMYIQHQRRECGCYLDKPAEKIEDFGYGLSFGAVYPDVIHKEIEHHIGPIAVKAFFIDETEVTNAQFKAFLDASGYNPKHPENFLKHWPRGKMPPEQAEHPVVYIDIEDAKAYARWAGKRLPTEAEWQLAAQGTDGRQWPWGNVFEPNNCTTEQSVTVVANSYPEGKSPYGCYHMSGNVWEWTDAVYDDGYTRFTMIRGGSYYHADGSIWYLQGNPQPCTHHAKFILIWPGLDRCSTVGFRCVKDID